MVGLHPGTARSRVFVRLIVVGLVLSLPWASAREPRVDPVSRRVRALYVGDTYRRTWRDFAFDPFLSVAPVPASIGGFSTAHIRRSMRQYMPRTYPDYESSVDLLILSDTDHELFTTDQQHWFKNGVVDDGQGLIMAGGFEAFGGFGWGSPWTGSSVEDALPVSFLTAQAFDYVSFLARPPGEAQDHPFATSLPWKGMPPFSGMNKVVARPGSTVLLETVGISLIVPSGRPVVVHGRMGEGASLAHAPDWNPRWGEAIMDDWEYYGDYLVNMAYLVVGVPVPQDIQLAHLVRSKLAIYFLEKRVALSLMDFAEIFGGNVVSLGERLNEMDRIKAEADELYLDQEYDAVLLKMEDLSAQLDRLSEDAVRIKDQALFWVYLVEWLAVTATLLVCGSVVWTLMVKRKAYREVGTSRLRDRT
jgi:uncharacterized membrane protein